MKDKKKTTIKEFIANWDADKYDHSVDSMIDAGWYDWFCKDRGLYNRLRSMIPMIRAAADSPLGNTCYVYFKNNCICNGPLYDNFGIKDIESGEQILWVTGKSGHSGQAEIYSQEESFGINLLPKVANKSNVKEFLRGLTSAECSKHTRAVRKYRRELDIKLAENAAIRAKEEAEKCQGASI